MRTLIHTTFVAILFIFNQTAYSLMGPYSVLYTHHLDQDDSVPIDDLSPQHSRQILSEDGNTLFGHTATKIYKLDFGLSNHSNWTTLFDAGSATNGKYIFYGDLVANKNKSEIYGIKQPWSNDDSAQIFAVSLRNNEPLQVIHEFIANDSVTPVGIVLSPDEHYLYGIARTKHHEDCEYPICKIPSILYRITLDGSAHPPYTILHSFIVKEDGKQPNGKLAISSDGRIIYGTTTRGGSKGSGTIFQVNLDGSNNPHFETIYASGSGPGGAPNDIILSKDERYLYGTAAYWNFSDAGYIYQLKLYPSEKSFKVFYLFRDKQNNKRMRPGDLLLSKDGSQLLGKTSRSMSGGGKHTTTGKGIVFKISLNTPEPVLTELYTAEDDTRSLVSNSEENTLFWGFYEDYYGIGERKYSIAQLSL